MYSPVGWHAKRIALIDPGPGDRRWFELAVSRMGGGPAIDSFPSEIAALKAFDSGPAPDLLVIDEIPALLDLSDLVARVKQIAGYEHVPIAILVTDLGTKMVDRQAWPLYIIQKPVEKAQLILLFEHAFDEPAALSIARE